MAKVVVVMISGKQGSGKSTTAQALRSALGANGVGVIYDRFAKPLYDAHDAVLAVLRPQGILPDPDIKKDGLLLQVLGNDWAREVDPNMWVRGFQNRLQQYKDKFAVNPLVKVAIICEDCRYVNEFDAVPDAVRVRLEAPEETRRPRTDQWRKNVTHKSEIDLDQHVLDGKFDRVFWTDTLPVNDVAAAICDLVMQKLEAMSDG